MLIMTHQEKKAFIAKNWHKMDDKQLGEYTNLGQRSVQRYRMKLNLKKSRFSVKDKEGIALVLELFANGSTIVQIAKLTGSYSTMISNLIERHWLVKKREINTITLVVESKINFLE
jgi:hypothetical protein